MTVDLLGAVARKPSNLHRNLAGIEAKRTVHFIGGLICLNPEIITDSMN
jgi:hypothetical protein